MLALVCTAALWRPSGAAINFPPDYTIDYTTHASRLHEDLLVGYVKQAPPRSDRSQFVDYSGAGTDVSVQIRFFKVEHVSPTEGMMRLRVWVRLTWKDLRLQWTPSAYGNITTIKFNANSFATPEDSEIWLPDITAYNAVNGFTTLEAAMARVDSSGTVYWSRPGSLEVLCRFSGLANFPFDTLSCPIDVGGWIAGGGEQGVAPPLDGQCATLEFNEEVSRSSYADIEIDRVTCTRHKYQYPCCPNDPYPIIRYRIYVKFARSFYLLWAITPSTLFTILSFSVFFMSFEVTGPVLTRTGLT
jgi:hypothetical protein